MEPVYLTERTAPELRGRLKLRWRNALSLLTGGILLLILGGLEELYVNVAGGPVVDGVTLAIGVLLIGGALVLFRSVERAEQPLLRLGPQWRVDRSLSGAAHRTVVLEVAASEAGYYALEALRDPALELTEIELTRDGARALWLANRDAGLWSSRGYNMEARIRFRDGGGRTIAHVVVRPVITWITYGLSSGFSAWVAESEALADALAARLAAPDPRPSARGAGVIRPAAPTRLP